MWKQPEIINRTRVHRLFGRGVTRGFTLIEVAIAGFVLATAVVSSLYALQMGFKMLETARNTALADQVLQSQIEDLRLQNYAKIIGAYPPRVNAYSLSSKLPSNAPQDMTLELTVTDGTPYINTITLLVTTTWTNSITKRKISRSYQTFYAQNGVFDYFISHH
jgi:Tfp pilus assembly protein PilV